MKRRTKNTLNIITTYGDRRTLLVIPVAMGMFLSAPLVKAQNAYITNAGSHTVSVIDTATNTVTATIPVGVTPEGVAVTPDGSTVYVANNGSNTVSVIDTTTNTVTATISVGNLHPWGVAVTPDGSKVYIPHSGHHSVSVIDTATNTVSATIPVRRTPVAFGTFIQQR